MQRARSLLIVAALALCGCHGKAYQVSEPVVGPAPPRINGDHAFRKHADSCACIDCVNGTTPPAEPTPFDPQVLKSKGDTEVRTASMSDEVPAADKPLEATDLVARVNGNPIFLADILEPQQTAGLKQMQGKAAPAEIRQVQNQLIEKNLPEAIDTVAMADAVWVKMKEEQQTSIQTQLDEFFIQDIERKMSENNIGSVEEFESLLKRGGMTLEGMRKRFGQQQLAMQYLNTKIGKSPPVTPADLRVEYEKRKAGYTEPAKVKWQQIQVILDNHPSPEAAREVMDKALAELQAGSPFNEVAKTHSEGPLAESGGQWDWTQTDSLANKELGKTLEAIAPNQLSRIIDDGKSLSVVLVNERQDAKTKSFQDSQRELRKIIESERRRAATDEVMKEIRKTAVIETLSANPSLVGVENPATPQQQPSDIRQTSASDSMDDSESMQSMPVDEPPPSGGNLNFAPGEPAAFPE